MCKIIIYYFNFFFLYTYVLSKIVFFYLSKLIIQLITPVPVLKNISSLYRLKLLSSIMEFINVVISIIAMSYTFESHPDDGVLDYYTHNNIL